VQVSVLSFPQSLSGNPLILLDSCFRRNDKHKVLIYAIGQYYNINVTPLAIDNTYKFNMFAEVYRYGL